MNRGSLLALTGACAASLSSSVALADEGMRWGGFGYAAPGLVVGSHGDIVAELEKETALGSGAVPGSFGFTLGGGGKALLAGTILVGGRGHGLFLASMDTARGAATLGGGGGGAELGVAVVNNGRWLAYPMIGVGGYGYRLEVTAADQPVALGDRVIAPGATESLASGFMQFELGLGVQRLLFWGDDESRGGFTLGGEVAFQMSSFGGNWEDEAGGVVHGLQPGGFTGWHFRLTIGGGSGVFGSGERAHERRPRGPRPPFGPPRGGPPPPAGPPPAGPPPAGPPPAGPPPVAPLPVAPPPAPPAPVDPPPAGDASPPAPPVAPEPAAPTPLVPF